MKKEGIQTRKRKPKNSHGPTKEPKSSKSSNSSSNLHNIHSLGSSHQYPSYDSARDAAAKAILNYEQGNKYTLNLFIRAFFN